MSPRLLTSITAIRAANRQHKDHFFDPGAVRLHSIRVGRMVWPMPDGSALFITSHQRETGLPRIYMVRICHPDGRIESLTEFQQFRRSEAARTWAWRRWRAAQPANAPTSWLNHLGDCARCQGARLDRADGRLCAEGRRLLRERDERMRPAVDEMAQELD